MVERRDGRDISRDYLSETEIGKIFEELMVISGINVDKKVFTDCSLAFNLLFRLKRLWSKTRTFPTHKKSISR